jgi:hypothetical protein
MKTAFEGSSPSPSVLSGELSTMVADDNDINPQMAIYKISSKKGRLFTPWLGLYALAPSG